MKQVQKQRQITRAFTLIEVLVVVAIIALLAAILIPSLTRAREQARLASCKANSKQLATLTATYQAEEKGFVPIMHNWHSTTSYNCPARASYLSLALRKYDKGTRNIARIEVTPGTTLLGGESKFFDPEENWHVPKRDDYEARLLPDFYVCPFARGKQPWDLIKLGLGPNTPDGQIEIWEWKGIMECYQTWLWEGLIRGKQAFGQPFGWDGDKLNGIPKYSAITWNHVNPDEDRLPEDENVQDWLHQRWNVGDAHRLESESLSAVTVIYCAIGEHMEMGRRWIDKGNHKTGRGGGTNAVFADTHVEWIKGTRIGWP
ncbi:MAG: prepilin-type N-terminal cleavage/methylation domain-containing protein [Planctomycetota bacterium]|jgi:prepilin-type N-terminal cleavage/methylation domain-containing protein/prepilin-type processing-associated H-X9-DG protein